MPVGRVIPAGGVNVAGRRGGTTPAAGATGTAAGGTATAGAAAGAAGAPAGGVGAVAGGVAGGVGAVVGGVKPPVPIPFAVAVVVGPGIPIAKLLTLADNKAIPMIVLIIVKSPER